MVENGGLQVRTTLNYELQQKAEEIIREHIEEVEEDYDASNAALVAVEA
jgi:membrane peptidoglycan carboxypeptidase